MEYELKINVTKNDFAAFAREAILRSKINKVFGSAVLLILTVHTGSAIYFRSLPAEHALSILPMALITAFYFAYLYLLIPFIYARLQVRQNCAGRADNAPKRRRHRTFDSTDVRPLYA